MNNDLISRAEAEKALELVALQLPNSKTRTVAKCVNAVHFVPAADAELIKRGTWIEDRIDIVCSNCRTAFRDEIKFIILDDDYEYPKRCPECGAIMDGGVEVVQHGI